ncbi:MAG: non-canonical purine NTP pyrophosphatase, RdgB/HAM1 family [Candidatus Aminicenantes bacterium]|nr:RdgB/HAM1 family non-canonical purine NTP pyrophosphatase [Candidatus Aminicenantes bacterium]RLE01556.1 MAG: non-canonical purine NTP pyrophosphatase, RdgB/HAM1 family [Candidatus Aminicenantes bacterium]HHF42210.1 RdgB/HAM1 family non-canonical purine NTP pyrophosphatase [Candidatus Aminicenantes bacterium]
MAQLTLLLASHNQGKIREIKKYLASLPLKITSLLEEGIKEKFQEVGTSFAANARGKAFFYARFSSGLTLAEDSGLEIENLGGAPGVHSARFAGEEANDEANIEKVLTLLEGVPLAQRKARFVCWMVLVKDRQIITEISAEVAGYILEEKRGTHGFGYDPIFFYPPLKKTFAELTPEEKNSLSHRGKALFQLKEFLKQYLEKI